MPFRWQQLSESCGNTWIREKRFKSEGHEIKLGEKEVRDRAKCAHTLPRHTHRLGGGAASAGQQRRINIRSTSEMIQRALWWFLEQLPGKLLILLCRQAASSAGLSPDPSGVTGATMQQLGRDRGPSRTHVLSH